MKNNPSFLQFNNNTHGHSIFYMCILSSENHFKNNLECASPTPVSLMPLCHTKSY